MAGVTLTFLPFFLESVVSDLACLAPALEAFGLAPRVDEPWLYDQSFSATARQEQRIKNVTNLRVFCWRVILSLERMSNQRQESARRWVIHESYILVVSIRGAILVHL